jgi:YD repeat-containing protein
VSDSGAQGLKLAHATYDPASGELTSASYPVGAGDGGNGTALAVGRTQSGAVARLTWTGPGGAALADDLVARSQSGKVVDESVDGADANPGANNFAYDAVGRLTDAWIPGHHLAYGFALTGGCGSAPTAGRNGNRTSMTDNGATPAAYCYNALDQLTSTSDPSVGTIGYDGHGNTTTLGSQTLTFDAADRHTGTKVTVNGVVVTDVAYLRDGADRITSRTDNGAVTPSPFVGPATAPLPLLPPLTRDLTC